MSRWSVDEWVAGWLSVWSDNYSVKKTVMIYIALTGRGAKFQLNGIHDLSFCDSQVLERKQRAIALSWTVLGKPQLQPEGCIVSSRWEKASKSLDSESPSGPMSPLRMCLLSQGFNNAGPQLVRTIHFNSAVCLENSWVCCSQEWGHSLTLTLFKQPISARESVGRQGGLEGFRRLWTNRALLEACDLQPVSPQAVAF